MGKNKNKKSMEPMEPEMAKEAPVAAAADDMIDDISPEIAGTAPTETPDEDASDVSRETMPLITDEETDGNVFAEATSNETSSEEAVEPTDDAEETDEAASEPEEISSSDVPAGYQKLGLYIHIPFCKSKCAYCDFYSSDKVVCKGRHIPDEMKRYCTALKNHMKIMSERTTQHNVDTVFIGGGTPTALPPKLLLDIVKEVDRDFYMEDGYEFTVEMNPATADKKLLKQLRKAGVNRLSIGLQSAHNHELAALSRIHTTGDFTEAFQMAREAGFDNINVDVVYGIAEQAHGTFMGTLEFVCAMKPEHISMYNLRIEDGTPFGERKHMLPLPDEDTECAMYFDGIDYLASQGYHQYEISNFARDGYECRHNLKYWHGEEYIGVGPAAHSFFSGTRFSFRRAMGPYLQALENPKESKLPKSLLDENYKIDRKESVAEYIMLRLRLCEGISSADFEEKFGGSFDDIFAKKLQIYIDNGFMIHENGRYAFTPKGMFVSNYILARIIPFEPKYAKNSAHSG
ncbi:MAG: radical SAM family heme chaperone HemW [Clostridia bacterium]|nr:radical SAM family heme chaperone HemW [Clostridia bacterium]